MEIKDFQDTGLRPRVSLPDRREGKEKAAWECRLSITNAEAGPMPRARRWAPETCFRVPPCAARRSPAL